MFMFIESKCILFKESNSFFFGTWASTVMRSYLVSSALPSSIIVKFPGILRCNEIKNRHLEVLERKNKRWSPEENNDIMLLAYQLITSGSWLAGWCLLSRNNICHELSERNVRGEEEVLISISAELRWVASSRVWLYFAISGLVAGQLFFSAAVIITLLLLPNW